MRFHVTDGQSITLNSSKSLLIRQLIISFLYNDKILEISNQDADDVKIVYQGLLVLQQNRNRSDFSTIDVKDCGAAERFLMAVAAITPGNWLLTGNARLLKRPILPLISALQSIGADIQSAANGWKIIGKSLTANSLTVDCAQSSQFASAIALISKKVGLEALTTIPSPPPSAPYFAMTQRMMASTSQCQSLQREGDWSTAIFWYAFLAVQTEITSLILSDLRLKTLQGDVVVADIFQHFGIQSEETVNGVRISKNIKAETGNRHLCFDLTNHPDLAPVMAVTALLCGRNVTLNGLQTLNQKESRRLDVLEETLSHFTIVKQRDSRSLEIWGENAVSDVAPIELNTFGDHRSAMAFALLALRYAVTLSDTNCISKSYPAFAGYVC